MAPDRYRYFRVEARELLDGLGAGVMELASGVEPGPVVGGLLRLAHTLKGASRVVKLVGIADRAHALEELLAPHRESTAAMPAAAVNASMRTCRTRHMRALRQLVLRANADSSDTSPSRICAPRGLRPRR